MDKSDPPMSFGVFKPVGYTVMAFGDAANQQAAAQALAEQGFAASALVHYTPQELVTQVDSELPNASPLASIGQEMNLVKAHRALAEAGCGFLVVHTPDDEQVALASAVANNHHAVAAQSYGRFIVEELVEKPAGETQVFESPDRGLDLDVAGAPTR